MFDQLPKQVKEKVLEHLKSNDFRAAKALHDECLQQDQKIKAKNPKSDQIRD